MNIFNVSHVIGFAYFIICAIVARKLMKKKGYCEVLFEEDLTKESLIKNLDL